MMANPHYYKSERAMRVCRIVHAWMILDALDKGTDDRVLRVGLREASSPRSARAAAAGDPDAPDTKLAGSDEGAAGTSLAACDHRGHSCAASTLADALGSLSLQQGGAEPPAGREDPVRALRQWSIELVCDLPRQRDGHSCGVFMLAFAESILHGLDPASVREQDVTIMRLGVAITLLQAAKRRAR